MYRIYWISECFDCDKILDIIIILQGTTYWKNSQFSGNIFSRAGRFSATCLAPPPPAFRCLDGWGTGFPLRPTRPTETGGWARQLVRSLVQACRNPPAIDPHFEGLILIRRAAFFGHQGLYSLKKSPAGNFTARQVLLIRFPAYEPPHQSRTKIGSARGLFSPLKFR